MYEVKLILVPEIYEIKWYLSNANIKKIERLWKSLPEASLFDSYEYLNTPNIYISSPKSNESYIIFRNFVIKEYGNIFYPKNDCKREIENIVLKTIPKINRHALLVYLNSQE